MSVPAQNMSVPARLHARFVVLMGVSGVGKTTVGKLLARRLGWDFFDADAFHPEANVEKMRQGIPLTDEDREEWLERLSALIGARLEAGEPAVLACSALRRTYRAGLKKDRDGIVFVYLRAPREVLEERLGNRKGHYFNPNLLDSQIAILEAPLEAVVMDAAAPVDEIVRKIELALRT